jgi:hypothetical protein
MVRAGTGEGIADDSRYEHVPDLGMPKTLVWTIIDNDPSADARTNCQIGGDSQATRRAVARLRKGRGVYIGVDRDICTREDAFDESVPVEPRPPRLRRWANRSGPLINGPERCDADPIHFVDGLASSEETFNLGGGLGRVGCFDYTSHASGTYLFNTGPHGANDLRTTGFNSSDSHRTTQYSIATVDTALDLSREC